VGFLTPIKHSVALAEANSYTRRQFSEHCLKLLTSYSMHMHIVVVCRSK